MPDAKILIVEDEAIEALDIQQRLKGLGYPRSDIAHNGEEGVRKAEEERPDLVLMDIMMPGRLDGVAAAERIRSRFDIPIVFLTAYADEETLRRAKASGPHGYIVKPFQEKELHIVVDMALYRHEMERARKQAEHELRVLNAELEQRVRNRTAQLEAANRELEAFSYSVSHDLRAPLRHITGFVELLHKRYEAALDERGRHYLDTISDSARQMGVLIDDLLSFSRMGRSELSRTPVDIDRLLLEVISELMSDTAGRVIEWRQGKLPVVSADPAMLKLALVNLVGNAIKFTRTRPKAVIEIGVAPGDGPESVVYVRDNGVGFDEKYVDKLFCLFQRLHRPEDFEGTGVGLANVRRIISRHGGRTWAEGSVDNGATFYFSLPRQREG